MKIDDSLDPTVIKAAGGILWRRHDGEWRVGVVHRPKYDDWSLPKGKLEPGESWLGAAVREVREETGFAVRVQAFAGTACYIAKRRPKVVLYWNMEVAGDGELAPNSEVDRLKWLSRRDALHRLDHPSEEHVLRENADPGYRP